MENTQQESNRTWRMHGKNHSWSPSSSIASPYTRNESMLTRRICGKNPCVHGEYVERIYAYMENTQKESMRTWRMRGKNPF